MKVSLILSVVIAVLQSTAATPLQDAKPKGLAVEHSSSKYGINQTPAPFYRLDNKFSPINYEIQIQPLLDPDTGYGDQFTAPGKVSITVMCNENSDTITLHSNLIEYDFSTLKVYPLTLS